MHLQRVAIGIHYTCMYVRWQNRKRARGVHHAAVLVTNARVKGKPKQQHVAYLGGITTEALAIATQRAVFWDHALAQLQRLHNRITPAERKAIIAALASKVPGPPSKRARAQAAKAQAQRMADHYDEAGDIAKDVKRPTVEQWEQRTLLRRPDGSPVTVSDALWRLCELAYNVETGNAGMSNLTTRTQRLRDFADFTGISLHMARVYAMMWRKWVVELGDRRR
jgi:hypothetical protein